MLAQPAVPAEEACRTGVPISQGRADTICSGMPSPVGAL